MNTHKRNRRSFRQCMALLAALAAILTLLWVREQTVASQRRENTTAIGAYDIHMGSELCYAVSETTLAVASSGGWQLFDKDGQTIAEETRNMDTPVCLASDAVSIFYSVGESALQLAYPDGNLTKLETDGSIRFADVNQEGQISVITDRDGYQGSVTVYSKQLKPLFQWDGGTAHPTCVRLSSKGEVAIACITDEGSRLMIFRTDRQEPLYQWNTTGERILDLAYMEDGRVAVLTDSSLLLCSSGKGLEQQMHHTETYPALFDASAEFAALVCTAERFGGSGTLYTLSANGKEPYALPFSEEILDISLRKNRILLLTKSELILCSQRLETIDTLPLRQEAHHIFLRPDNTALAVGSHGADSYNFGR